MVGYRRCTLAAYGVVAFASWPLASWLMLGPAASADIQEHAEACLECHAEPMTKALEDGSELSLEIDLAAYLGSVHGETLACADCHIGYDDDHPFDVTFADRRAYVAALNQSCSGCHLDASTHAADSVHEAWRAAGGDDAPVCSDCHGAHDVGNPHDKSPMISRSCARCHAEAYEIYAASSHGRGVTDGDADSPACADCHDSHTIRSPGEIELRLRSPGVCLECHGDREMMERHGLSAEVGPTYLSDFHGVTASLTEEGETDPRRVVVTCVDCHGYHQIASTRTVGAEAMKQNVHAACVSCHENSSPDFPAAWLSHYPPSLEHAPLVWAVDWVYKIVIPFIVIGLVLQIVFHLYRVAVGR